MQDGGNNNLLDKADIPSMIDLETPNRNETGPTPGHRRNDSLPQPPPTPPVPEPISIQTEHYGSSSF